VDRPAEGEVALESGRTGEMGLRDSVVVLRDVLQNLGEKAGLDRGRRLERRTGTASM
jgi:hypothetical protein